MPRNIFTQGSFDLPRPPRGVRWWIGAVLMLFAVIGSGFFGFGACGTNNTNVNTNTNTSESSSSSSSLNQENGEQGADEDDEDNADQSSEQEEQDSPQDRPHSQDGDTSSGDIEDEEPNQQDSPPEDNDTSGDDPDLGRCRTELQVGVGQRCFVAGQQQPFEVYEEWAWSPWDRRSSDDYNHEAIKVDEGDPVAGGVTFQARRQISKAWTILVSSPWQGRGECSRNLRVGAGEYCIEQRSEAPFLVYATDELNPGETRPLYLDGYAVLFWLGSGTPDPANGLLHDQQVRSGDHFLAEAAGDGLWRIVRAD